MGRKKTPPDLLRKLKQAASRARWDNLSSEQRSAALAPALRKLAAIRQANTDAMEKAVAALDARHNQIAEANKRSGVTGKANAEWKK